MSLTIDGIAFLAEDTPTELPATAWKVLVVDDEAEVHRVTHLALGQSRFDGQPVTLLNALSAAEAKRILADHCDIALILLDVVMETDDAGLCLVRHIREDLANKAVRIVLRTGQPGQAPEQSVIVQYDINDYKAKSELTAQKLATLLQANLRSYRDIMALERNRRGLEQILEATASLGHISSLERFSSGVLEQLAALLHLDSSAVYCGTGALATRIDGDEIEVLAGIGTFAGMGGKKADQVLPETVIADLRQALAQKTNIEGPGTFTTYCGAGDGRAAVVYLSGVRKLDQVDLHLAQIFARNVGLFFHNLLLSKEIEDAQKDIVLLLSEAVERRSLETGNHVRRVAKFCGLIAKARGWDDKAVAALEMAAPLHDLGKIGVPDAILNKPGRLTEAEWQVMKTHTEIGHQLLASSRRPILRLAAEIALQHHEKWDGTGYPVGLCGEAIGEAGRIAALADVFDALASERGYKPAWPLDHVMTYIRDQKGRQFDPDMVEILEKNIDQFLEIRKTFPDVHHEKTA